MLFKHFTLTFFALAASVNALAIPLHSRRADNLASTTGNNGAPVAENNAPKIALPPKSSPPSVPNGIIPPPASPPAAASYTDSPSQQSKASSPLAERAANSVQMTTPAGAAADKPTTGNIQTVKSTTDTPTGDNTVQTTKSATGTPEPNDVQGASTTKDGPTTPAANNSHFSKRAADTPEANSAQTTTPNKDAADTTNSPTAQSAIDSSVVNNNNTPAPLATTPDAPSPNGIQPQSQPKPLTSNGAQPQSPGSDASEPANSQTTPPTGPDTQPAPATQPNATPDVPAVPAPSIECLALLMKTQQPLTGACHKLIRDDPTLIQLVGLGSVDLDFMYSGKDFPVISSDGLRLKLQEIPGYTLSVVEARYDVTIIYKSHDTVSFSPPWAPSTMQASIVNTPIDQVDVKVLSNNAFSSLIAAMLTKPKTPVILTGTVDINLSIASTDGGAPKSIIIAGLQFSSKFQMPGLNGLTKTSFVQSENYEVYRDTFYFSSVFEFMNPSNIKLTLGGVKFDVLDSAGKQVATSAVDVFEIGPNECELSLRLIAKVDDSAAFLNRLHYTGDTVTIQGTVGSSKNPLLKEALSQLKFSVTYPPVADVPPQNAPVAVDTPLPVPAAASDIPPINPVAIPPGL